MSSTNIQGNLCLPENIPYNKYFEFFSYENWSFLHYVFLLINNYKYVEKSKAHHIFFITLQNICRDSQIQEVRDIAQNIINNKNVSIIIKNN